jgi:hypothetical protein
MAITENEAVRRAWDVIQKSPQRSDDEWRYSLVEHKVRKQHRWAVADSAARKAEEDAKHEQRLAILKNLFANTYSAK